MINFPDTQEYGIVDFYFRVRTQNNFRYDLAYCQFYKKANSQISLPSPLEKIPLLLNQFKPKPKLQVVTLNSITSRCCVIPLKDMDFTGIPNNANLCVPLKIEGDLPTAD